MNLPPDIKITTQVLLTGMFFFILLDMIYVPILVWRVKKAAFLRLKWNLVISSSVVWFSIWAWVLSWGWDLVYAFLFPSWTRVILPFGMALFYAAAAWLIWQIAWRASDHPVLVYCLLWSATGILTHIWAVSLGITQKPPILQSASPVAAVSIAAFEFTFYGCIILTLAVVIRWVGRRVHRGSGLGKKESLTNER